MPERDVRFLYVHGDAARDLEKGVGMVGQPAAALARHRHDTDAGASRRLAGGRDIGRTAAGRDADHHVTGASQRFNLPCKDSLVTEIIRVSRQERAVRGQGERRQTATGAMMVKGCNEFRGKML